MLNVASGSSRTRQHAPVAAAALRWWHPVPGAPRPRPSPRRPPAARERPRPLAAHLRRHHPPRLRHHRVAKARCRRSCRRCTTPRRRTARKSRRTLGRDRPLHPRDRPRLRLTGLLRRPHAPRRIPASFAKAIASAMSTRPLRGAAGLDAYPALLNAPQPCEPRSGPAAGGGQSVSRRRRTPSCSTWEGASPLRGRSPHPARRQWR